MTEDSKIAPPIDSELQAWLDSSEYLPDFLKDDHDAKDFFKHMIENRDGYGNAPSIDWRSGSVYVLDYFLYIAAKYGYTLQPSSDGKNYPDLEATIQARKDRPYNEAKARNGGKPPSIHDY